MNAREAITNAADRLFGELGYHTVSTREIADAAGVNLGLIHYYFKTKEGLYEEVLGAYYEDLLEVLTRALETDGTPRERIGCTLDAYVDFLSEHIGFSRMVQREASDPRRWEQIAARMKPMFSAALQLMHAILPASERGPMSADQVLVSVYGMISTYFTYTDMLGALMKRDALGTTALKMRKAHLRRVVDLMLTDLGLDVTQHQAPDVNEKGADSSLREESERSS